MTQSANILFGRTDIDESATIASAKDFLNDYKFWHLQKIRLVQVQHLGYKELPTLEIPSERAAKIELECFLRLHTIQVMHEDDTDNMPLLADILRLRYIKGYTITKTCFELSLTERSFTRRQNEALLSFALICPFNLISFTRDPS